MAEQQQQHKRKSPDDKAEDAEQPVPKKVKADDEDDIKVFVAEITPPVKTLLMPASVVRFLFVDESDHENIPLLERFAAAWRDRTRPPRAALQQRFVLGSTLKSTQKTSEFCALCLPANKAARRGFIALLKQQGQFKVTWADGSEICAENDFGDDDVIIVDAA